MANRSQSATRAEDLPAQVQATTDAGDHRNARRRAIVGVLALALLFVALSLLLVISERLTGQPLPLIPLFTPGAFAARSPVPSPSSAATTASLPALPTSMPQPTVALLPADSPTPPDAEIADTAPMLQFALPVSGRVSVGFSQVHPALDFDAPIGTTIIASERGRVIFAGWNPRGYGNLVVVNHPAGWQTWYAHLESISVNPGAEVCRACPIGTLGNTGSSSGPHLHFEIRRGCALYNLFTGERLAVGIPDSYLDDPFGAPVCLAAATASPSFGGPAPHSDASVEPSTTPDQEGDSSERNELPP